jgi:DNA topoisomerase IA
MIIQPGIYAILSADLQSVQEIRTITEAVNAKVEHTRPVVMTAQPAFDAATQKVIQNGWTISANDVTPIWQIVALSQAELDEIASRTQAQQIIDIADNFIAGNGTATQVREALGRLLKRLAKNGMLP